MRCFCFGVKYLVLALYAVSSEFDTADTWLYGGLWTFKTWSVVIYPVVQKLSYCDY